MARDYRSFVGGPSLYDVIGAIQFNLLVLLGMRESHTLLDIGCGSLRGGRFSIVYLQPGRYFGIEPESWLVEEGIRHNLGAELVEMKQPSFLHDTEFSCSSFGRKFDYLLAQSIFSHAAPAQIERCFSEAAQTMHAGSVFLATFNRGAASYSGTKWVYPSVAYTDESMREMAAKYGLSVYPFDSFHPGGQTWMLIGLRSSAARLGRMASSLRVQSAAMPAPPTGRVLKRFAAG